MSLGTLLPGSYRCSLASSWFDNDSCASDRLIAHASVRFSGLNQVSTHPFFKGVKWKGLQSVKAPFVPALDSEVDTGYYDNFTSPEDMAKYEEVKEKQRNVEKAKEKEDAFGRGVWVGFTFGKNGLWVKALTSMEAGYGDRVMSLTHTLLSSVPS